ncbi:hypothetical protein SAMN05216388_1012124 [Halorientalis persicus]|uniref:Thioredoxin domain-containing protein n=1 Tax=Halorientalis persicus TaxID=1367881 RepID=A0A1H8PQT0_9EURY|nr:DUF255 domain-containing protein [Halorientalis persicus]SEO44058.1 hypothetical protein SAMN05216388_1012124 [Halorientalis persicus]
MDDSAARTNVEWREWGQDAFDEAARAKKPVLLSLSAPWCAHCHQMDATTYTEPRIAANINDGFVPVRVDVDRYPRVRERYNMGGFPSTVFCTPSGDILTGAGYLGVDGFREILDSVRRTWDGKGEEAGRVPRALRDGTPPSGEVRARIEEHMVEQLLGAFDDEFGGWGSDTKFPLPRTVEFALVRDRDQATRTLEAIQTHLLDTYDGGFYRFATGRDWSDPHREKLLDENAALVRAFARAYRYTGEASYRETAETTVEYLTTDLWTGEAFAASQASDDEYYRMSPTDREDADPPSIDETVLADRNGMAAGALLALHAYTDDESARRYAERALDHVLDELVDDGEVTHYRTDEEVGESGLLADQTGLLQGLTTAWQVTGAYGDAATAVADYALAELQDEDGGAFRDGTPEGPGLLDEPLYPLDTNVELADALVDLAALTGEDRYRERAREAIAAFAGAAERMGVEVASYATVASRLQSLRVFRIGAPAGSDLHRAALRVADHEAVVVPAAEGLDGEAEVVDDGEVTGTAETPDGLAELATGS